MFKQGKKLLYLLTFVPFLTSCDNIPEDDRYIDTGAVNVARKVLLEEFTGQRCTNCPDAHQIIERLEDQYGDDLIVVSIHAGPFGVAKENDGLMQAEGDIYADYWNISAYPAGVVDRNSGVETMNQWAGTIYDDFKKVSPLEMALEAQLNEAGDKIEIFTTLVSSESLSGSLQLWVVENDIVGFQIYGRDRLYDYVHNNVFRACVNGVWGEEQPLKAHVVKYVSNEIPVDSEWVLENVRIVGFYYNSTGVVQVERCAIK